MQGMERTAIFPGSFDPFTVGHKEVVDSAIGLFDRIVVGVGINREKPGFLSAGSRVRLIRDIYGGNTRVEVRTYEGLTVDFCREAGASFILRGMRNNTDFEFERNMAQINRAMHPEITTVLMFTPPQYVAISSSIIREIYAFGGDVSQFMPEGVNLAEYL